MRVAQFYAPVESGNVVELKDRSFGMTRVEVRSANGDSHLATCLTTPQGRGGLRYCINSAALRFIPYDELDASGYGDYKHLFDTARRRRRHNDNETRPRTSRRLLLGNAGLIRKRPGIVTTRVGYSGGDVVNATYRHHEGHAEAIEIIFDPSTISYRDILALFFQIHDPTTKDRQGNDVGTSYRRRSSTSTTNSVRSPRTSSPTSMRQASGRARSSPKSLRRERSGKLNRSIRTTS